MDLCFAHFEGMKKEIQTDSQIKIAYYYRRRLKMLKKEKDAAAKAKKGKKGKKGAVAKKEPEKTSTNSKASS